MPVFSNMCVHQHKGASTIVCVCTNAIKGACTAENVSTRLQATKALA